ncbi:cyk-3 [Pristionchus pacificus]|uniref:ubiquitinyl hydrolase 1 n=1 Tax=Pristionchus pacificus TaxID=54126 RepID=A0A2A6BP83_PRIPA|nr:cyk-3 [Pristionchus pacificus]|eukprot:PDM67762.1 cyk-3 [Pristionchus pacificus]
MGNRIYSAGGGSEPPISLAQARAHLSNDEFVRLQNAFGRLKKSQLNLDDFSRHVLGGANVPDDAKKTLFRFFSNGSDGISFDNLICALVGISRSEYAQEQFIENHTEFATWGLRPPLLTIPINDAYINFYEVMSYVTHLSVSEVQDLERVFLRYSTGGVMLVQKEWEAAAAGGCFPQMFTSRLLRVFDDNCDGEVDFREMVCGVSAMCRGPLPSRFTFLASIWDEDGDGHLNETELAKMYEEMKVPPSDRSVAASGHGGKSAAPVDVAQWAITHSNYVKELYTWAQEIGHICFGLRPETPAIELEVVRGFVHRMDRMGASLPTECNILSAVWYREWETRLTRAAAAPPMEKCEQPPPIDNSPLLANVDPFRAAAKLSCISPENACLRRDLTNAEWLAIPRVLWSALVRWHGLMRPSDEIVRRRLPHGRCPPEAVAEYRVVEGGEADDLEMHPVYVRFDRRPRFSTTGSVNGASGGETREPNPWAYAQISRFGRISDLLHYCSKELKVQEQDLRLWLLTSASNASLPSSPSTLSVASAVSSSTSPAAAAAGGGTNTSPAPSLSNGGNNSPSSASPSGAPALLDDPRARVYDVTASGGDGEPIRMLLEQRDRSTGVWPEEARFARSGASIAQSSLRGPAVGLINYGNFCYRNAAVQCLARVEPLTRKLIEKETELKQALARRPSSNRKDYKAALQYIQLVREMRTTGKKNISPVSFNDAIRETRAFDGALQHDCEEFVSFMLQQLHELLKEPPVEQQQPLPSKTSGEKKKEKEEEEDDEDVEDAEAAAKAWRNHIAKDSSLITTLFSGQLRSELVCKECSKRSACFDPFSALPVPIGFENVELFEFVIVLRDGSRPIKHGLRLPRDATTRALADYAHERTGVAASRFRLYRLSHQNKKVFAIVPLSEPLGVATHSTLLYLMEGDDQSISAVHRRMQHNQEPYLLGAASGHLVMLFGVPIMVKSEVAGPVTGRKLYDDVWRQLKRFISTPPPSFASRALDPCEDISAGFPFSLCLVDESLEWCATCPPLRFCRGCALRPDDSSPFPVATSSSSPFATPNGIPPGAILAVDWQPIALYLKYNHSRSEAYSEDPSISAARDAHIRPSSLDNCLRKFAAYETLDDLMQCKRCKKKTKWDKHMDIWKLPRYLIVQLKRFEYIREEGRKAKCKRVIDFPLSSFDASPYVKGGRGETERREEHQVYDCIALANHYGDLDSGHFIAYARSGEEREDGEQGWLLLNDCTVREVSESDIDKKGAYLLFYERRRRHSMVGGGGDSEDDVDEMTETVSHI